MPKQIDLSFYLHPPETTVNGLLTIDTLSALSMVSSQPGAYFRSELQPTHNMVYGLLENALGWHFADDIRKNILKQLVKSAKKLHGKKSEYRDHPWLSDKRDTTGSSNFTSLLEHHVKILTISQPEVLTYDDLWSMHLRDLGTTYIGGSRNYDYRMEQLISRFRSPVVKGNSKLEIKDLKEDFVRTTLQDAYNFSGNKLHPSSIRDAFPMYYVSPKKRGYVLPQQPYACTLQLTPLVAQQFDQSLNTPQAAIYLGHNEGWVDINWKQDA
ncbi:MAG: hypothetical protein AAF433_14195 [Bacteroidota bacterium]